MRGVVRSSIGTAVNRLIARQWQLFGTGAAPGHTATSPAPQYLSCFPDLLYGSGGFYDHQVEPKKLIGPAEQSGQFCELLEQVYPAAAYARIAAFAADGPDPGFLEGMRDHYGSITTAYPVQSASLGVVLRDCVICNNVLYCRAHDGFVPLYETHREHDRPYTSWIEPQASAQRRRKLGLGNRSLFYVGSVGTGNYGHWLIDDLPRLKLLDRIPDPVTILLTGYGATIDRPRQESAMSLAPAGRQIAVDFLPPTQPVYCEALYYATPISYHPVLKSPEALAYLRRIARQRLSLDAGRPCRRLFLPRRAANRRLINEAEIWPVLRRHGFDVVVAEELNFSQQSALFAEAEIVVGVMGAAMTNTVFAEPGTRAVYLAPTGWLEPFYWDLASVLGHGYSAIFGETSASQTPPQLADFRIDPERLSRHLATIL